MTTLVSPGIQVIEHDRSTYVAGVDTTSGAIGGVFHWGPVDKYSLVTDEGVLRSRYGSPSNHNGETWFTAASFLAYANKLYVSRAGDVTGNTAEFTFTGNSINLGAESGNNIIQLGDTSTLSVGMVLLYSNAAGIIEGSTIAAVTNATHIQLSSDATANIQSHNLMFRENIIFTAAALQSDLSYNESDVSDWDALIVKNEDHYNDRIANGETFDVAALYVARYPGAFGNSLRVAVCDSANQYSEVIDLTPNASINSTASVITANVGSNTLTVTMTPANTAGAAEVTIANAYAATVRSKISIGDLISVGNTRIGYQTLKVQSVAALSNTANVYSFTVSVDDELKLAANVSTDNLTRYWEFYNSADSAPALSDYVRANGNTSAVDELHVVVVDEGGKFTGSPGAILEVHRNLSRATDAQTVDGGTNYYKNVINESSDYVWFANDRTTARSNTAVYIASSTATAPLNMRMVGGSDGLPETTVPFTDIAFAYDKFADDEEIDISLVMQGKARGTSVGNYTQLANYITDNITEKRIDCVAFISPDKADVVSNKGEEAAAVVQFRNSCRASSYAFLDSGYKYMYDKYNDVYRWVPLNGDIAGLCARTDLTNDAWWSPAGLTRGRIKNLIKLAYNPKQADRDILYKADCNPVISSDGLGTYLYGDKTLLGKPSAFDRLNVRRLFISLEKSIKRSAKNSLFEFNDDFTRAQFRNQINPFLRDVKGKRGIYAFLVVCDTKNNTPEVIDRNEFIGDIYIKPAKSINYIILNFVAVRTGVSFTEVILNQ